MDKLTKKFRSRGHRITQSRLAITDILSRTDKPLTVSEIRRSLSQRKVTVDKVTVYRELTFLVREGIAGEVDFGEGAKRFESADRDHHHVVCVNCRRVEDVVLRHDIAAEERRIAQKKGFTITHHALEFFGLCASCR